MNLLRRKNRDIGAHLKNRVGEIMESPVTDADICRYFVKVGLANKGDFQSYWFAKGSTKAVALEVDLIALGAACAGVPLPSTPVFADVGVKARVTNTRNNLLAAVVSPQTLEAGGRKLSTESNGEIIFLAMTGYRWESGVDFSAEIGVKAEVPNLPSFGSAKGEYGGNDDKPTSVESGTYAELAAFEINVGAKASVQGSAGISGERLYLSDTVPTFIRKSAGLTELEKHLMLVLKNGDKKACIKAAVQAFLTTHDRTQQRSFIRRLSRGGSVSTDQFLEALTSLETETRDNSVREMCRHHIRALEDFRAANVLGPYNFISLWGMKPQIGAGISASAQASVSAEVGGIAGAGAGASVELKGPSVEASLKFTRFRVQTAGLAADSRSGSGATSGVTPGNLPARTSSNAYAIMTQDTSITYGQMDLTIIEASANAEIAASQSLVGAGKLQTGRDAGKSKRKGLAIASVSGEAVAGLEEIGVKAEAAAGLKKALNFMQYESAVAFWAPPKTPGRRPGQTVNVPLAQGSGFSFGQSVDTWQLGRCLSELADNPGRPCGYVQGLAKRLNVTYKALTVFLKEQRELILDIAHLTRLSAAEREKYKDHLPTPTAFLIESSFGLKNAGTASVDAMWSDQGRWVLGPGGRGKTLRGKLIGKQPREAGRLQAIRLRYRMADDMRESKTRFSLGIKYIVRLGIEYASVEEAGSEGIVNLGTTWFNDFSAYNTTAVRAQAEACEKAVPQVVLIHQ
ncbi:MAG: hypothetical protein MI802_13050 [Desulfobacterales bacterium]|nr:hypothetical protein [Desulfobacterales bacterium]